MSKYTLSAATIAVAVAEPGRGAAVDAGMLSTDAAAIRKWVMRQPDRATLLVCYEAGPTGFGLACQLGTLDEIQGTPAAAGDPRG